MHSSAQVPFSVAGPRPIAALDTQAALQEASAPLSVNIIGHSGPNNLGPIVSQDRVDFLVWPAGYLRLDLDPGDSVHVTEIQEGVDINDLGVFLKTLYVNNGSPAVPGTTDWKDTVYTAGVSAEGFTHEPVFRYLVIWAEAGQNARGVIRALQGGGSAGASVVPSVQTYQFHTGGGA
ncbi:MAG TPA: hypothetical protein VFT46_07165 [Holophagaceae bacterium]|nr:hypothetical protein [Holophagaceae bacterium]